MDALEVVTSGVVGAVAGALASIGTAARIARASERGRVEEESRQRILAAVRLFRSQVAMERGDGFRNAQDPDFLGSEERKRFAKSLEGDLVHVSKRLRSTVRGHRERLVGPLDARTAAWSASRTD